MATSGTTAFNLDLRYSMPFRNGWTLSPGLIIAFSLLGLFPLLARKSLEAITRVRAARANAAGTESNG